MSPEDVLPSLLLAGLIGAVLGSVYTWGWLTRPRKRGRR